MPSSPTAVTSSGAFLPALRFLRQIEATHRTPLTLILGPLDDMLAKDTLNSALRNQLNIVNRNAHRLLRLVNSLLDFSKLEAGRMMVRLWPCFNIRSSVKLIAQASYARVNLGVLTADLASLFRSAIERAGMQYEVQCDETAPAAGVYIDAGAYEIFRYGSYSSRRADMWEKVVANLVRYGQIPFFVDL